MMQHLNKSLLVLGLLSLSVPAYPFIKHVQTTKSSGCGLWKDVETTSNIEINMGLTQFSMQLQKQTASSNGLDHVRYVSENIALQAVGVIGFAALMVYAIVNGKAQASAEQEVSEEVENS